jgi:hypothetical protein
MPNAAATVLPWKRLPSVSAQIVRSRISRSPARKADSSIGPACTATTRPSSVRVTVSRQGTGMPGSCWALMEVSIQLKITISLFLDPWKVTVSSAHRAFPHGRTGRARPDRAPARQLGRTPIEREVDC